MFNNEIRNVDDASSSLITQRLFSFLSPNVHALVISVNTALIVENGEMYFFPRLKSGWNSDLHIITGICVAKTEIYFVSYTIDSWNSK